MFQCLHKLSPLFGMVAEFKVIQKTVHRGNVTIVFAKLTNFLSSNCKKKWARIRFQRLFWLGKQVTNICMAKKLIKSRCQLLACRGHVFRGDILHYFFRLETIFSP